MTVTVDDARLVAGDLRLVPPKRCGCGRRGEWPGRLCPECREQSTSVAIVPAGLAARAPSVAEQLADLANQINTQHGLVICSGTAMVERAITCGELLLKARELVPGYWLRWFSENVVDCHIITAQRYMRLAQHKTEILDAGVDSIANGMRLLSGKPRLGQGPRGLTDADKTDLVRLYESEGMNAVLKTYGLAKSTVWRYVSPRSPHRFDPLTAGREPALTDDQVERMADWLVARFGGYDYPERVTNDVRLDARAALKAALTAPSALTEATRHDR